MVQVQPGIWRNHELYEGVLKYFLGMIWPLGLHVLCDGFLFLWSRDTDNVTGPFVNYTNALLLRGLHEDAHIWTNPCSTVSAFYISVKPCMTKLLCLPHRLRVLLLVAAV